MCYNYEDKKNKEQQEQQIQIPQQEVQQNQIPLQEVQQNQNPLQEALPRQQVEADPLQGFVRVERMEEVPLAVRERLQCKIEVRTEIDEQKDSRYMQAVKGALAALAVDTERAMLPGDDTVDLTRDRDSLHEKLNAIEEKYHEAIEACEVYLAKREPTFFASLHKRYQSVKSTKELLTKELGYVTKLRIDIAENPQNYQGKQKVSFLDLVYQLRERKESIQRLEMKDYVKMLTDKKDDSILCRNGQLYRRDSKSAGSNPGGRTSENYKMLDRFVNLILERQNSFSEVTKEKIRRNLMRSMGADLRGKVAGPVNMGKMRELVVRFNRQVSEVDRRLIDKKEGDLAYQTASKIQELLGSAFLREKNQKEEELERQRKQQIAEIQEACKAYPGYVTLNLTKQQIQNLVKGQLQAARDKAFLSAMKIYRMREKLGERQVNPLDKAEMKLLLGMALSQVVTEKEDIKDTLELQIRRFEREQALKADQGLKKDLNLLDIEELRTMQPDAIRLYVEKHPQQWQEMNEADRKKALKALTRLMENMQEISTLSYKGLMQGLTADEAALFQKRLEENQRVFSRNRTILDGLRKGFPEGSAMEEGLSKLKMRGELNGFGVNTGLAKQITDKLQGQVQEANQQEVKPIELISEEEAFSEALQKFPKKMRLRLRSVFLQKKPFKMIEHSADRASYSLLRLLEGFQLLTNPEYKGRAVKTEVRFQGDQIELIRDKYGIVTMKIENHEITLPHTASYWLEILEEDLCVHFDRYDKDSAKRTLLRQIDRDEAGPKEDRKSRVIYERFLTSQIGARAEELAPLTNEQLRGLTLSYCSPEQASKEQILQWIKAINAQENNRIYINSQAAVENLIALENLQKKNKAQEYKQENKQENKQKDALEVVNNPEKWTEKQQSYLNLMGELYFSSKTKLTLDQNATYTVDRLKEVLRNNKKDFLTVAQMTFIERTNMALSLKPFQQEFEQAVTVFNTFLTALSMHFFWQGIRFPSAENLEDALKSGGLDRMLADAAGSMAAAVNGVSNFVQGHLNNCVNNMEEDEEDRDKTIHDYTLAELVEKSVTGNDGEGAFNKLVLSRYVSNASPAERQKMVACALKNVPKLTEKDVQSERSIAIVTGKFMAGYVKGAGPLLHKMMQGLPISSMPIEMQEMVKDVRSNLMQIDEDIVDAQLQQIIDESGGEIHHIEKVKVLGSASVGQTLLVKVYESANSKGIEKVVKILKPDVQNTLAREIKFMENCAKEVDRRAAEKLRNNGAQQAQAQAEEQQQAQAQAEEQQQAQAEGQQQAQAQDKGQQPQEAEHAGGMLKTFRGKTAVIRRELDLRLEADNVEKGKIYEDELLHIRSMRVDPKTKSTIHTLVLEKAPGQSVDNYMTDMNTKRKEIEEKVTVVKEGEKMASLYGTVLELQKLKKELETKKKYLVNLTQKWLDEAVFKSGFFHGDLHAGNIMMDDDGVTIIDYGNVNVLAKRDQKNILNLLAASMRFNEERVLAHIKDMLRDSPESYQIFEQKEAEIRTVTKDIIKKEDGSPVDKILVVFHELQKREIEIPAGFYNFIQCFMRMIGTMADYNAVIDNVDRSIASVMERRRFGSVQDDPEVQVMSPVVDNILSRNFYELKDTDSLDTVVDKAINSTEFNPSKLLGFCEKVNSVHEKNQVLRENHFQDSKVICVQERTAQLLGFLYGDKDTAELMVRIARGAGINFEDYGLIKSWYEIYMSHLKTYILGITERDTNGRLNDKIKVCNNEIKMMQETLSDCNELKAGFELDIERSRAQLRQLNGQDKVNKERYIVTQEQILDEINKNIRVENTKIAAQQEQIDQFESKKKQNMQIANQLKERAEVFKAQIQAAFGQTNEEAHTFNEEAVLAAVHEGIDILREFIVTFGDDKYEQNFLRDLFDYNLNPVLEKQALDDEDVLPALEKQALDDEDILPVLTEEEKELRRQKNEAAKQCRERLINSANEVHQRSNPKSYKDKVVDAVLNRETRTTFGKTLASWFADEKAEGEALRTAYEAMVQAGAQAELTKDSPEVVAFVEAFLISLKSRITAIEKITAEKNGDEDAAQAALVGLVAGNLMRVLRTIGSLDYMGISYIRQQKLSQNEKNAIEADKKVRKTSRMKPLFDSLKTVELKQATLDLKFASGTYTRLITMSRDENRDEIRQDEIRAAKENLEKAIQNVMANIAKLNFKKAERKKLEEHAAKYQDDPTAENLLALIHEAGVYLNSAFKGTSYGDTAPAQNQIQGEPQYLSQVFTPELTKLTILPEDEILKLNYKKKIGQDGKEISLLDRLKAGETIEWIKNE